MPDHKHKWNNSSYFDYFGNWELPEQGVWLHFPKTGPIYCTEFSELHNYRYIRVLVNYEEASKIGMEYQFGGMLYVWNKQIDGTLYVISNVRLDGDISEGRMPFVYLFLQRLDSFNSWSNSMPRDFIPSHLLSGFDCWGGGVVDLKSIEFFKYGDYKPEVNHAWYHVQRWDGDSDQPREQDADAKAERSGESEQRSSQG